MGLLYRENEESQIYSALNVGSSEVLPSSLFVTGPPGCGKRTVVSSLIGAMHVEQKVSTFANVSCIPATIHIREFFDAILRQVSENLKSPHTRYDVDSSVANFSEFVATLNQILEPRRDSCVISITNSETMRNLDPLLLPGILRLAEICQQNICVIFVSRIPWSRWQIPQWSTPPPITFTLTPYTKTQVTQLLVNALKSSATYPQNLDEAPGFFNYFSDVVVGTFYIICRSYTQILQVAQLLFPVYIEPVIQGTVDPNNTRSLIRHAEPHIKECLSQIHLREDIFTIQLKKDDQSTLNKPSRLSIELPYYSKFLLIAAFLASYNPAKSDKRFFVQNCGRIRKKAVKATAVSSNKRSSQLLGPKPFPLDRMLAIFYVIVDHKVPPRSKILSQVSSLVSIQLLSQTGTHDLDCIDSPKYKCNVSLDFIKLVSKNVRFEVHKYLYDANF